MKQLMCPGGTMKTIKRACPFVVFCIILLLSLPIGLMASDEGLEYTVQKGDTLWDISSGKLKDPFLWPKLWKANPHIHNPHLIYPNEKVVIPSELLKEDIRSEKRVQLDRKKKLLTPGSLAASRPVPIIKKAPIVSREVLLESGYFAKDVKTMGRIVSSPLGKTLFGNGDAVYLTTAVKANPDEKYYVITKPEAIMNPLKEKEIAGYQVMIKGVVVVTGDENGKTKASVSESYKEINVGDMIIEYYAVSLPVAPSIERKPAIAGIVLGIWNKRVTSGKDDVVYLSRGAGQGLEIGDVFTITSATKPRPVVGSVQVFTISDAGSAAIIRQSMSEIKPGDTFGN
jgi:hypothetical protein